MLNALRQSEENHDLHIAPASEAVSCSTPYGNQRKITGSTAVFDGAHIDVLNALRQSEENHSLVALPAYPLPPVLNALRQSEENHANYVVVVYQITIVLNALRQSEENHGAPQDSYSARLGWSLCKHVPLFYTPTAS